MTTERNHLITEQSVTLSYQQHYSTHSYHSKETNYVSN